MSVSYYNSDAVQRASNPSAFGYHHGIAPAYAVNVLELDSLYLGPITNPNPDFVPPSQYQLSIPSAYAHVIPGSIQADTNSRRRPVTVSRENNGIPVSTEYRACIC